MIVLFQTVDRSIAKPIDITNTISKPSISKKEVEIKSQPQTEKSTNELEEIAAQAEENHTALQDVQPDNPQSSKTLTLMKDILDVSSLQQSRLKYPPCKDFSLYPTSQLIATFQTYKHNNTIVLQKIA